MLPALILLAACSDDAVDPTAPPPWLESSRIEILGFGETNADCRAGICQHNENTDLVRWEGDVWMVHRTAESQVLGPNSSLHVYRSTDEGATFVETAVILAPTEPTGRDIRDPHFYIVDGELFIKALARLPVLLPRDTGVDTLAVLSRSADGVTWSDWEVIGPPTWSFWRIREQGGMYYNAAYEDGDRSVYLFSSPDGVTWTRGAPIYRYAIETPLETELTFLPSGRLMALVRTDLDDDDLLGNNELHTVVCWSSAPYTSFDCPSYFDDERLDGPLSFLHDGRLFVVARKHLDTGNRKRTALYEISGNLEGGTLYIKDHGELPSAGDTAYAGMVELADDRVLVSWYSGDLQTDESWAIGMLSATDIWIATIDLSKVE